MSYWLRLNCWYLLTTYTQAWVDLRPLVVSITIIINQHLRHKTLISHYFDNLHKSAVADWLLCWGMNWITHSHTLTAAGQKHIHSTATSQVYLSPCNSSFRALYSIRKWISLEDWGVTGVLKQNGKLMEKSVAIGCWIEQESKSFKNWINYLLLENTNSIWKIKPKNQNYLYVSIWVNF